jgi:beta-glucosidase-like glycosyl hydrolase
MLIVLVLLSICFSLEGSLSLEEKVGQLLIVHFHGEQANAEAGTLLEKAHVGGFIYYNWANSLSSPYQVQQLSLSLQKMNSERSGIPLFLAVDQEGGRVNRLKAGFTEFPSQEQVAKTGVPELAFQVASAIGDELKKAGVNFNCAPVIDVHAGGVIGDRSFGGNPQEVALFGEAALGGYQQAGVICALKHFPGYGAAAVDAHSATPVVRKPLEKLKAVDLYPFQMLALKADAIMTGHLIIPALDPRWPATLSPAILTGILRNEMGFQGVIISDSLVMKGLTQLTDSYEEAALQAFHAGCDLLCLGGKLLNEPTQDELTVDDVLRIHQYLVQAILSGRISEERLNASVERILKLKAHSSLDQWKKLRKLSNDESVSNDKHLHLKETILLLNEIQDSLSPEKLSLFGERIWENECHRRQDQLVFWNPKEGFASLGIGHFIWYPENAKETFTAGFPRYLTFLKERGVPVPPWISQNAPWKSREEFLQSDNAHLLRAWLLSTLDLQTAFIAHRFKQSLHRILSEARPSEFPQMIAFLHELICTPEGLFALIDYLNFKGDGLSSLERYQGQGWGLYQVLLRASSQEGPPLAHFQKAAREILSERVANAAPFRDESRFLSGWLNRINRYSIHP